MHKIIIKEHKVKTNQNVKMDYGMLFGYKEKSKEFVLRPIGEAPLQTYIDDTFSAIAHMTNQYLTLFNSLDEKPTEETMQKIREKTYTRLVQTFSLTLDQVFPEMKDRKYDHITDDEMIHIQDELLQNPSTLEQVKDLIKNANSNK